MPREKLSYRIATKERHHSFTVSDDSASRWSNLILFLTAIGAFSFWRKLLNARQLSVKHQIELHLRIL
jgi:hypothetical protein